MQRQLQFAERRGGIFEVVNQLQGKRVKIQYHDLHDWNKETNKQNKRQEV